MRKRTTKTLVADPRLESLLAELKRVATDLGIEVRQEKLLRDVGYRVRSGSCRVRESRIILLDRALPLPSQIDILVGELADEALDNVAVPAEVRQLLQGGS